LTSDSMLQDKLEMFELWVDDYLTKPFEIEELVARLKSLLKRWEQKIDDEKISWNLKINYSKNKIYFKNNEVNFPHKQYLILEFLMNNIWYPQNKVKIMEYVWWEAEENLDLNSTTLESHIYVIRKIIGKDIINTVKGIWYIIEK
jgi:DNA-binding response OmpR family regulator